MTKKVEVKAGDEKSITVHADRDLFGRLLIVANTRQINFMEVLSYELSPIPCSLAHQDGMAVIQMIKFGHTAMFGELAKHYFNIFTSPLSTRKCYCVHVVFDQYLDDSIKAGEWARRAH